MLYVRDCNRLFSLPAKSSGKMSRPCRKNYAEALERRSVFCDMGWTSLQTIFTRGYSRMTMAYMHLNPMLSTLATPSCEGIGSISDGLPVC